MTEPGAASGDHAATPPPSLAPRPPLAAAVWLVGAAVAALLLLVAARDGYFRDELYYLMCARQPAWGYVDHPPLAMALLDVWAATVGTSVLALRVVPAVLAGLVAVGAAGLAREMRGQAPAQLLAAVAAGFLPAVLALGSFYSMNAFDLAFWVLAAWLVCRLLDPAADRRLWWALGATFGLGLLNKYSLAFLGVGLGVGLLLSPLRRELLGRRRLLGSLLVVLIVLPHVVWQVQNGWPTLEFMRNAALLKNRAMGPSEFWGEQLLLAHPLFLPLWLAGLGGLLVSQRLRRWRPLGVAFVVIAVSLTFARSKPYYLAPAYPMVLAAGSVVVMEWLRRWRRGAGVARMLRAALPVVALLVALPVAPLAIPLLTPQDHVRYASALGIAPAPAENNPVGALPQHLADRHGWPELASAVRGVVAALPADERSRTLVVASNYGECGAINHWGLPDGVRPAVSGHNSCFTWWPEDFEPDVVVLVGFSREAAEETFEAVELAAVHRHPWAMPYESDLPIWVCRGWRVDPQAAREAARFAI